MAKFCIHPFVASPYFLCESAHPGEVTRQRPVARLYASVKISVNESAERQSKDSFRVADQQSTQERLSVLTHRGADTFRVARDSDAICNRARRPVLVISAQREIASSLAPQIPEYV